MMNKEFLSLIEPLSNILGVDLDLVDTAGIRLAATGIYKNKIGKKISEFIYEKAITDKEMVIIENPTNNKECRGCFNASQCMKKIIIAVPIFIKKEVIGVLGILSFNEKKRDEILDNIDNYTNFLNSFSKTIGTKIFQDNYFDLYHELFLKMSKAVIILNEKGLVLDYNRAAHVAFQNVKDLVGKKVTMNTIGQDKYELTVSNVCVDIEGAVYGADNGRSYIIFKNVDRKKYSKLTDGLLLGKSKVILELNSKIQKISTLNHPVIIKGDMGTDKTMVAKLIHNISDRSKERYVSINCRDESEDKLEEKIFGNDINKSLHVGLLESVDGGSLFIDEIEYLPLKLQKKLLYFIKSSKINPANSEKELVLDVRIIVATRINLLDEVKNNNFLENLYYELNSNVVEIPSLRYRKDDMEDIIQYLVDKQTELQDKNIIGISEKAKKTLMENEWPGNWKELESTIKIVVESTKNNGIIEFESIPEKIRFRDDYYDKKNRKIRKITEIEREEIIAALIQYGVETEGKQKAAKKLGIGIATLYRKMENYQIDKKDLDKIKNSL